MSIIKITSNNFESEVVNSDDIVLVDFWAEWCGPCRMVAPIIDEISNEISSVKICKVNVDDEPELARKFGIESIPTLLVLKNGKVVNSNIGVCSKAQILSMIKV